MASNNSSTTHSHHSSKQTPQTMEGYDTQGRESVFVWAGGNQSDTPVSTRTLLLCWIPFEGGDNTATYYMLSDWVPPEIVT